MKKNRLPDGAPFIRIANLPMIAYAKISCTMIGMILWPFKKIGGAMMKTAAPEGADA